MRQFDTARDTPEAIHAALTARDHAKNAQIEAVVRGILDDVKTRGDAAVLDYTRRFDWPEAETKSYEPYSEFEAAWSEMPDDFKAMVMRAENNITDFHSAERGHLQSWMQHKEVRWSGQSHGTYSFGQVLQPVERAGIYVPGGKALYPSTVLMTLLPAAYAGVENFVVCTPADHDGNISPILAGVLHHMSGIFLGDCQVFKIGGAQAIAAMAYGTETVPKCDVIVGPGNQYVNIAKKLVYGECAIDMLAGPSEVAVIADEHAKPHLIAADILAQTEHGHDNRGVLFCHSWDVLEAAKAELSEQRAQLSRKEILDATALNLIFVKTNSLEESLELSNVFAPEHLELMVREPLAALPLVKNAGAVLLGEHTSASVGDYWAGPSHTLPTAGAARFSSPLSVNTFLKRTSVVYYSQKAAEDAAEEVARFAEAEGFDGHAAAARLRGPHPPPLPHQNERGESSVTREPPALNSYPSPAQRGQGSAGTAGGGGH